MKIVFTKLFVAALLLSGSLYAAEKNSDDIHNSSLWKSFRCETIHDAKLSDFKEKLISTCNLDKPFSFTQSGIGIDASFTFCCHRLN